MRKEIGSKNEELSSAEAASGYVRTQQEGYLLRWSFYLLKMQSFLLGIGFSLISRDSSLPVHVEGRILLHPEIPGCLQTAGRGNFMSYMASSPSNQCKP